MQIFPALKTSTPSFDIIAVHDLGETASDAWTDVVIVPLAKSSKGMPERGKSVETGDIAHTAVLSTPPGPAPAPAQATATASALATKPKGDNEDSKRLVPSSLKPPGVSDNETSKAKHSRKARKDTALQMRSTEGSVQSSLELKRQATKKVNWIRDLLSRDIPRSRILTFSYQGPDIEEKPFAWTEFVDKMAKGLITHIQRARKEGPENRVPIVFIGYGFGGVIIQRAIELMLGGNAPMAGESPTDAELADWRKHAVSEKTSATANDTADSKDKATISAHDIYQILLLDTPFPSEAALFPRNTNVRMCSIIEEIEDWEKDSKILDGVWEGFAKVCPRHRGDTDIDVTWLHSQVKGRQTDDLASEMVNVSVLGAGISHLVLTQPVLLGQTRRLQKDQDHSHFGLHVQTPSTCENPGRSGLHLPRHSVADTIHFAFQCHIPPEHRCRFSHPRE